VSDFEKSLLELELRWAAQNRERALRSIKMLRRGMIVNYCVIGLYLAVGLWYAYLALMTDKGPWYLIYTAVWLGFIGVFVWSNRNSRRSIARWQARANEADQLIEKNSKEHEKYT
jgi:hypothetical protein